MTIRIQRKKTAVRAFTGIVGRPMDEPVLPKPVTASKHTPRQMIGPPLEEAPPDPFADRASIPPLVINLISKEEKEKIRKEKRAQAARNRRKLQREQIAAIKEKLKTPIQEIKKLAEEKAKLDKETKSSSMERGKYMTDAPPGVGELVLSGGSTQMESIAAAHDRAARLGSPTSDPGTGEAFWPDNDRRHVAPQGTGSEGDGDKEKSFYVTLGDGTKEKKAHDYNLLLTSLVQKYMVETDVFKSPFFYCQSCGAKQPKTESIQKCIRCEAQSGTDKGYLHVCRLCGTECDGFIAAKDHIHRVHGTNSRPEHDNRYGDITTKRKHPVTA